MLLPASSGHSPLEKRHSALPTAIHLFTHRLAPSSTSFLLFATLTSHSVEPYQVGPCPVESSTGEHANVPLEYLSENELTMSLNSLHDSKYHCVRCIRLSLCRSAIRSVCLARRHSRRTATEFGRQSVCKACAVEECNLAFSRCPSVQRLVRSPKCISSRLAAEALH